MSSRPIVEKTPPVNNKSKTTAETASADSISTVSKNVGEKPPVVVSAATMEARAAAARAYALSSATATSKKSKKPRTKTAAIRSIKFSRKPAAAVAPSQPPLLPPLETGKIPVSSHNGRQAASTKPPPASKPIHTIRHSLLTHPPAENPPRTMNSSPPLPNFDDDDDYQRFVRNLGLDDHLTPWNLRDEDDDDEEEFQFTPESDDDEDEEVPEKAALTPPPISGAASPLEPEWESNLYKDLEEELGGLLEEDLEAAMTSLMGNASSVNKPSTPDESNKTTPDGTPSASQSTPMRDAARSASRTAVTHEQEQELKRLMECHYQLLIQQAVLAVRAASVHRTQRKDKSDFLCGESSDDLAEILDGAVGMLQDLDQNRKDAIRNRIQLEADPPRSGRRSLLPQLEASKEDAPRRERRLTRAAFSRTLQQKGGNRRTAFDIQGLSRLKETFATIDESVGNSKVEEAKRENNNILDMPMHAEACKFVLRQAGASFDQKLLPGALDLSKYFSNPCEYLGACFKPPCSGEQQLVIRRSRNMFSSGEDNLVLRGVNLYGEKQWILIADRYLPDRSVNIISQRYSKLCVMMYKAHGVEIDDKGNLHQPPKLESIDDIDDEKVALLKKVTPPAILNVHRWSLEEDLTLLKAVPLMGHMWAELGARLIPHRDRGHLRKRYQVLERRVKATTQRFLKEDSAAQKVARLQAQPKTSPAKAMKPEARESSTKNPYQPASSSQAPAFTPPTAGTKRKAGHVAAKGAPHQTDKARKLQSATKSLNNTVTSERMTRELENAGAAECSRTAFEKLVQETSDDWSEMSKMKELLKNDSESVAVSIAKGRNVATSDKFPVEEAERLPQLELDENTCSGLSILNSRIEGSLDAEPISEGKFQNSSDFNIMDSVLGRASKPRARNSFDIENSPIPSRESPAGSDIPATPSGPQIFSTSGTPIDLSPGFVHAFRSRASPGSNFTFSPGAPPSFNLYRPEGESPGRFSIGDFKVSDWSRQLLAENKGFDRDGNSSALMQNDLDAISALNSLSNPAGQSPLKRSYPEDEQGEKKSLFAKVIGGVHEKGSKKRKPGSD